MKTNNKAKIVYALDNRCVYCGAIIPEGMDVCKACEYDLIYEYNEKHKRPRKKTNELEWCDRECNKKKKRYKK